MLLSLFLNELTSLFPKSVLSGGGIMIPVVNPSRYRLILLQYLTIFAVRIMRLSTTLQIFCNSLSSGPIICHHYRWAYKSSIRLFLVTKLFYSSGHHLVYDVIFVLIAEKISGFL